MKNNIGPISLISYISTTLIFFIVKSQFKFPGTSWIWYFLIITGIIQFINNLYITQYPEICGSFNMTSALTATIVPWIFIFGISCGCLVFIPGWLRVFSNTFGVMVANMGGLNNKVNEIFVKKHNDGTDQETIEALNLLYANRSNFMNEIDLNHYDKETKKWPSLEKILEFMKIDFNEKKDSIGELYDLLLLKEDAGYFLWLLLIGSISILVSTNSLLLSSCNSVDFNF